MMLLRSLLVAAALLLVGAEARAGCNPFHAINGGSTASTNSTLVIAGNKALCSLSVSGVNTTIGFLKIYDTAVAPTCSSATGLKHVYPLQSPASVVGGYTLSLPTTGEIYVNGIGFCIVGGGTDTDNTNGPAGLFVEGSWS